jgi:hypothetical protein
MKLHWDAFNYRAGPELKGLGKRIRFLVLALGSVEIDPEENKSRQARESEESFAAFVEQVRPGLLEPCGVFETADGHKLSFGYRRMRAMLLLHGPQHQELFVIVPPGWTPGQANLLENLGRLQPAPWETARALHHEHDERGTSIEMLMKICARSESHVRNMISCSRNLVPEVWAAFKRAGREAPVELAIFVAAREPHQQLACWNYVVQGGSLEELRHLTREGRDPTQAVKTPATPTRKVKVRDLKFQRVWLRNFLQDMPDRDRELYWKGYARALEEVLGKAPLTKQPTNGGELPSPEELGG